MGIGAIIIAIVMMFNLNLSRTDGTFEFRLANIEVLAQTEGGSSGTFKCYSTYNNCWFWNCSTIYRCGNPCSDVSADSYGDMGDCN